MSETGSAIDIGDRVEVEIESPNNPFGGTQAASFDAEVVKKDKVFGRDPTWGDECEIISMAEGQPHYADGGKSGDVVEIRVHETDGDGVPYTDRFELVYSRGDE